MGNNENGQYYLKSWIKIVREDDFYQYKEELYENVEVPDRRSGQLERVLKMFIRIRAEVLIAEKIKSGKWCTYDLFMYNTFLISS